METRAPPASLGGALEMETRAAPASSGGGTDALVGYYATLGQIEQWREEDKQWEGGFGAPTSQ